MDSTKKLSAFLSPSIVLSPEELYGGFGEALKRLGFTKGQRVYLILRRPALLLRKIQYPSTGILNALTPRSAGGNFSVSIECDSKQHVIQIPVLDLVWNMIPVDVKARLSRKEIESAVWAVKDSEDYSRIRAALGSILGVELKMGDDDRRAKFTFHQPNAGPMTAPFALDKLLGMARDSLGIIGEVIYIGQTNDEKNHRLEGHEKLQQVLAQRLKTEDILVMIGRFSLKRLKISEAGLDSMQISEDQECEITDEDKLSLIEMTLINYFKPELNSTYKDAPGIRGSVVDRSLVAAGYDAIEIHYDPDNVLMYAGSKTAGFLEEHHILYSIQNLE